MAVNDIRVWKSPLGGHVDVMHYRLDAGETVLRGEPVYLADDGTINQCATDPAVGQVLGIAAADGVVGTTIDWRTDIAMVENATIPVIVARPGLLFITSNFSYAGSAFGDVAPAVADLGEEVGLSLIGTAWGVDQAGAVDVCRIMDVLDANFESVQDSGGTGVYVVFEIVGTSQLPDASGTAEARVAT